MFSVVFVMYCIVLAFHEVLSMGWVGFVFCWVCVDYVRKEYCGGFICVGFWFLFYLVKWFVLMAGLFVLRYLSMFELA